MSIDTAAPDNVKRKRFVLLALSIVLGNCLVVWSYTRHISVQVPEWPIGVDLLVLLPTLYLLMVRPPIKKALIGLLALLSLGIFLGSVLIPAESKVLWLQLDKVRWLYLIVLIGAQAVLIGMVLADIIKAWQSDNLELAVHDSIEKRLGRGVSAELIKADARVWLYLINRRPERLQFDGLAFYARDFDSNASSMQAFLIIVALEIPVLHILIHFFSPTAALAITTLSLYGLLFLYADYRATLMRPITLESDHLHIRHGVLGDLRLDYRDIAQVTPTSGRPGRAKNRIRFVGMGNANILLHLHQGSKPMTLFGPSEIKEIFIGLDQPKLFREGLRARLVGTKNPSTAAQSPCPEHSEHHR